MAEDWRITVALADDEEAARIASALRDREVRDELRSELGERVAVSRDGATVFLYADTRRAADAATRVVHDVLEEERADAHPHLDRWHPVAERWEDASVPLPRSTEQIRAEQEVADADDDALSQSTGVAQWEVRIELDSHADAEALAAELEAAGRSVVRRSSFLLVGANDRDEAEQLAAELAARGRVQVEPSTGVAWQLMPANPFAVFGGLGA